MAREKKVISKEGLKKILVAYQEADKHGKKEILREIGMSQPTLWRRASEAGFVKVYKFDV